MWFDTLFADAEKIDRRSFEKLEHYYLRSRTLLMMVLSGGLLAAIIWANLFTIDQVARAQGEVISSSRVQVIQSVDGGVLAELLVREGDRVEPGQLLATLNQTRFGASVKEIEARLAAQQIKAARLRAEVTGAEQLQLAPELERYDDIVAVERALFSQRRAGFKEELQTLQEAVDLAAEEEKLTANLARSGDTNQSEVIRAKRALNDARAKLINYRNDFFEQARVDLTKAEDEIAQNTQVLTQRRQQLEDSVFVAKMPGIVKNIRVTTVGGVLRAGEELMQIVPTDDELILEAKVSPIDIAQVEQGLPATIRLDPYDYTIYGSVAGEVVYVSADTLKEETARGEEIYYRAHIRLGTNPATTSSGKPLEIMPGMTAQVDIRTGRRTVMEYLLKPLRKTLAESLGER